jgi:hypothetical protein
VGGPNTRCQLQLFGERQLCKKADAGTQRDASAAAFINSCYGLASNERTAEQGASSKQCSTALQQHTAAPLKRSWSSYDQWTNITTGNLLGGSAAARR